MKKSLVIIAARGLGDLIYHLPLLRFLYESYGEKLIIFSNKVNQSKEVYKHEKFYEKIIYFDNSRLSFFKTIKATINFKNLEDKKVSYLDFFLLKFENKLIYETFIFS